MSNFNFISLYIVLLITATALGDEPESAQNKPLNTTIFFSGDTLAKPVFVDSWTSRDKGLHFTGSLIATSGIYNISHRFGQADQDESLIYGAAFTLCLGIGKELLDAGKVDNHFSVKDLSYDILGIIIAGVLVKIE